MRSNRPRLWAEEKIIKEKFNPEFLMEIGRCFCCCIFSFSLFFFLSPNPVLAELDGPPITDNQYNLDFRQGPIVGSAKQVALGGAYIGFAEGIYALNSNPAGVALRKASSNTNFDWDWTVGVTNLRSSDFDNNGTSPPDYKGHTIRNLGLMGQWGDWGVGIFSQGEIIGLENSNGTENDYVLQVNSFNLGRAFKAQGLALGMALRTTSIKLKSNQFDAKLGEINGVGWSLGGVWTPNNGPLRFGCSLQSKILSHQSFSPASTTSTAPVTVNGLIIPSQAILPAQLGFGTSYQLKSAKFLGRRPFLVAADVVIIDSSENAVGVESVIAQKKQTVGAHRTMSVRGGAEVEALPKRLRVRLGSYYEPSFYAESNGRIHTAGGFEVRLLETHILGDYTWGFTYTFDVARDYLNQYFSLGFWTF